MEVIRNKEFLFYRIENAWKHAGYASRKDFVDNAPGITQQDITNWKSGQIPTLEKLLIICNVCDCDLSYLIGENGNTFKSRNKSIQEETGLSEAAIELLRAWHNENSDAKEIIGIKSTPTELVDLFIRKCLPIAERVENVKIYNSLYPVYNSYFDMNRLHAACVSIHDTIDDPLDRWHAFLKRFRSDYPDLPVERYSDNKVYRLYMFLCNSHMGDIDTERYGINQQFDKIIDMLLSGEAASEDK